MHSDQPQSIGKRRKAVLMFATIGLLALAVACYWYGANHSSHLIQGLSLLILMACPLMHLFGHHHHHEGHLSHEPGKLPSDRTGPDGA